MTEPPAGHTELTPTPSVARRAAPLFPAVGASYFGYAMMATLFVPMLMTPANGYLPVGDSTARRTTVLGVLLVLYPIGQFVGNSVVGALSDRFGRRPVLLLSGVATVVCYVGIAVALQLKDLVLLAPILLVCGLVEANTALAMSAIADVTTAAQRPRYIALVYAVTSVAYTIGPLAGGLLAQRYGYALPFWVVLVALVAVLGWLAVEFRETLPADRRQRAPLTKSFAGLSQVLTDTTLRRQYLANFLAFVSVMGFGRVITIYLVDEWQLTVGTVTACYSVLALAAGVANFVLTPWLSKRYGLRPLAIVTLVLGGVAMAAVTAPAALDLPKSLFVAVALTAVAGLALAVSLAAVASVLSAAAPAQRQGTVLGNNAALLVLGEVVGVSGGAFLAGLDTALPLLVLGALALAAAAVMRPAQGTPGTGWRRAYP